LFSEDKIVMTMIKDNFLCPRHVRLYLCLSFINLAVSIFVILSSYVLCQDLLGKQSKNLTKILMIKR